MLPAMKHSQKLVASGLVSGACIFGLQGCGGKNGDAVSTGQTATVEQGTTAIKCPATNQRRPLKAAVKFHRLGKSFTADLSPAEPGGKARVQATSVRSGSTVGEGAKVFSTENDARFVSIVYTLTNTSAASIVGANTVSDRFTIKANGNSVRAYLRADRTAACADIGVEQARALHVDSPKHGLKPGESYKTVAVYVVPKSATKLAWASDNGHRVALPGS